MKAISLFSGAGGFEIGLQRAGVETVLQAESDPWCLSVLERHWPDVYRVDDVRSVQSVPNSRGAWRVDRGIQGRHTPRCINSESSAKGAAASPSGGRPDLIYGGFPCQDLSVAGKRAGIRGERSSLWFEFERVLRELRPRWALVENVPGLLSSDGGRDFSRVLMGLGHLGYGWAYRVLDARWFGVPQRRRRVFIVGCLGDARRAAQVLAVCESCGGYSAARREASQDVAPTLDDGAPDTSRRIGNARREAVHPRGDRRDVRDGVDVAYALPASARGTVDGHGNAWNTTYLTASTLSSGSHPGRNLHGRHHEDDENLVIASAVRTRYGLNGSPERGDLTLVAGAQCASDGHHGHSSPRGDGADNLIAQTLNGSYAKTTASGGSHGSQAPVNVVHGSQGVRRLTPLECERLMGWPDEHTRYGADGKEIPDSHRYRLCGNGVVATVAEWLGHRLMWVDAHMSVEAAA